METAKVDGKSFAGDVRFGIQLMIRYPIKDVLG